MKKIVFFVLLFFCFVNYGNAGSQPEPVGPGAKGPANGESSPPSLEPAPSGPKGSEAEKMPLSQLEPTSNQQLGEIFFGSGTISNDGRYLYVILDKYLFQYLLPSLDLKQKVVLDIAVAPVTPSISISKDSKTIYIIYNGILLQVDAVTFKIEKRFKISL